MKLETFKSDTKETFVTGNGITVSVYQWGNLEGCSFMLHQDGETMPLRCAASLRWEELDTLLVALTAARSM
jgi:hypothetical protein